MKSMMPRFFGVFLLLSHEARVRVTSLQLSDTGLPGLAKKANHALQLEVSRMLQDGDALAAFHQFRVFLEFQEHRGKLSKCSCAAEKSGDAVITASGGIDQHAPDVEQPEHSKQGLAQGFPDPETMILHTAVSDVHSELQHAQHVKEGHFASSSVREFNSMGQTELSQWNESSSQAESATSSHHRAFLGFQQFKIRHWSLLFENKVSSWRWWLNLFRSWTWGDFFLWLPFLFFCLLILVYPRVAMILIWITIKQCVQVGFNFLFHKHVDESNDRTEEDDDDDDDTLIVEHGIAPPANMIWQTPWDELTEGQRFVFGELGIHDKSMWLLRCGPREWPPQVAARLKHSIEDWDRLRFTERSLLSRIGFSSESWHGVADEMRINEKTWYELTRGEKNAISKFTFEHIDEEKWNMRSAKLFHIPWTGIPKTTMTNLRELGFDAKLWRPYRDPKFTPPAIMKFTDCCRNVLEKLTYSTRLIFVGLILLWTFFVLWRFNVMQLFLDEFGAYILLFLAILACVVIVFSEIFVIMRMLQVDVVNKIRSVHLTLSNFWESVKDIADLPHNFVELVDDVAKLVKIYKGHICKSCKSCNGCTSCMPWKP